MSLSTLGLHVTSEVEFRIKVKRCLASSGSPARNP